MRLWHGIGAVIVITVLTIPEQVTDVLFEVSHYVVPISEPTAPVTLLLVGDIMLGRDVENYLAREGVDYPFRELDQILSAPDLTIGNFEGIVHEPHVQAPSMTFQFSVRREYLKALKDAGFDVLSLANNHSSDYGDAAMVTTRALCTQYGLRCEGQSRGVTTAVHEIRGLRIGFLFGHTTWGTEDVVVSQERMSDLVSVSDIQLAYLHWGSEYALVHEEDEEVLAHALIDAGADAVIGHHPHVVQDVALYQGKPIFYSLGNFIFDQYWNEDVRTGLGVHLSITATSVTYTSLAFTTEHTRNQPSLMSSTSSERVFNRIFADTDTAGLFQVQR
jgi:gamma-polyglutamate biosynthesis protein CapA